MPNGKIGDHPYTDIVVHDREIYSALARSLVREIASVADEKTRRELADMLLRVQRVLKSRCAEARTSADANA
jgi:predicted house-cleaning noncanonical NTP pyrophosphatase (MazG superfamily)